MTSKIDIFNYALNLIGQQAVSQVDEDSLNAEVCRTTYDMILKGMLDIFPWAFSIVRVKLSVPIAGQPVFDYRYSFTIPSDCIRILQVGPKNWIPNHDYRIENRTVLVDTTTVFLKYVSSSSEIANASPLFIEALSAKLALEICNRLNGSVTMLSSISTLYMEKFTAAKQREFSQSKRVPQDQEWIHARFM